MEGHSGNPITVKVEEHSQSIVLTYFQGDIGSMVDAHFTRALSNKSCKAKAAAAAAAAAAPSGRSKKSRKAVKTEHATSCQWSIAPSTSYSEAQFQSAPGSHQLGGPNKEPHSVLPLGPADNLPGPWPSFPTRHPGLSPMPYSLSPEGFGLSGVGQQYANSLLNLLHSDRGEVGQSMGSGSKTDLLPSWTTAPPGYRDPVDPAVGFETGRDKKDLYWY